MAQNSSRKSLKYRSGTYQKDGDTYFHEGWRSISTLQVRRYGGSLIEMVGLTGTELLVLNFLTEVMDNNQLILHNSRLREKFQQYMSHSKMEQITDKHLISIMGVLAKTVFLISTKKRGEYYVNPLYFAKSDATRERLIVKLTEEKLLDLPKTKN